MKETNNFRVTRRKFLGTVGAAAGGLIIGFHIPEPLKRALAAEGGAPAATPLQPNAFIQIAPDESITLVINKLEMGQGVNTSMAQLIAEELECDWRRIRAVSAPVNPVFNHTAFGTQMTGGSTALASSWDQHRRIGAGMREMLKAAAAARWGVPVKEVRAENGFVRHAKKGKLSYGALAEDAAKQPFPENIQLKDPKTFKVIGKSMKRIDALEKSNGKAIYGIDVRVPGMLYAAIARPPLAGASLDAFDESEARLVKGVEQVVRFGDSVAVLAKNTHAAKRGRDALSARWTNSENGKLSSAGLMREFRETADTKGIVARESSGIDSALAGAKTTLSAEYEFPYLAHASMEPMNCTINYSGETCEIWSGHQMPTVDRDTAAKALGLAADKVTVNTTYAGGSFGRRANKVSDYVVEACALAKIVKKPLKVFWTREDDMRGGYYRPLTFHKVNVALGAKKELVAWDHRIVGQSVIAGSVFEPMMVKGGLEATIIEGVADTKYAFPHFRCEQHRKLTPVTTLWWRSVGHTHTAYAMETMMDELAEAMGKDPLALRRELLKDSPRHMAVLNLLAKQTGWGKNQPSKGRAWGLAVHESFNSVVGQVAEVSIKGDTPKVHKLWAAVDCGHVVNPEGARTQVESAIVFALSAAFFQEIQITDGRVVTGNFHEYPVMRIQDMPKVDVAFVQTTAAPTGLGEPGVPPAAPAVANALYRLTKQRLRTLPFARGLKGGGIG